MKLRFNDATEITVQQVEAHGDYLRVLTVGNTPEQLRVLFSDTGRTAKMTVIERGQTIATYEGYTSYQWTENHPGQIYGVVVYKPEKLPEVQTEMEQAAVRVAQIQAQLLDDAQALTVKAIYPQWADVIGQTVPLGYKFLYGNVLYKTIQDNLLIQEQEHKLLREIIAEVGQEGFLKIENQVNASIQAENSVISPGGSVVYCREAMEHYKKIGTIVYLKASYPTIKKRIRNPKKRGVVLKEGQSLKDLYYERVPYFEKYADITICEDGCRIEDTIGNVLRAVKKRKKKADYRKKLDKRPDRTLK